MAGNPDEVDFGEYFDVLTRSDNDYITCSDQIFQGIKGGDM